jgi:hypothetical protein
MPKGMAQGCMTYVSINIAADSMSTCVFTVTARQAWLLILVRLCFGATRQTISLAPYCLLTLLCLRRSDGHIYVLIYIL